MPTINLTSQLLTTHLRSYLVEKCHSQSEQDTLQQTEECLRFLYLCHLTEGSIPVNEPVDNIWHLLILQTKEYFALCETLPAKHYIHHTSDVYSKYSQVKSHLLENSEAEAKRQLEWLVSYVMNFGDMTADNIKYWSFAAAICVKLKLSFTEFNLELRKLAHK